MVKIRVSGILLAFFLLSAPEGHSASCVESLQELPHPVGISAAQWQILSMQISRSHPKVLESLKKEKNSLRVADLQDLLKVLGATEAEFRAGQLRYKDQMILPTDGDADLELLMASDLDREPRESFRVSLVLKDRQSVLSDIRVGARAEVSGDLIKTSINQVLERAQNQMADGQDLPLALLIFSHTHTVPDLYLPTQNQLLPSELSRYDIELGKTISKLFAGVPVLIKAILQNGYTYQQVFKNGAVVDL